MAAVGMASVIRGDDRSRFSEILVDSFPADERDSPEAVIAKVEGGQRRCALAKEAGTLLGFAVTADLAASGAALLEYLAVARPARGLGTGGALVDYVVAEHAAVEGLVLEVDPPDLAEGAERALRQRRVEFYARHGASIVDGARAYRAPSATGPHAVPYLLMWRPIADPAPLAGERLRAIVTEVLTESYDLTADDPFVQSVLGDLGSGG